MDLAARSCRNGAMCRVLPTYPALHKDVTSRLSRSSRCYAKRIYRLLIGYPQWRCFAFLPGAIMCERSISACTLKWCSAHAANPSLGVRYTLGIILKRHGGYLRGGSTPRFRRRPCNNDTYVLWLGSGVFRPWPRFSKVARFHFLACAW